MMVEEVLANIQLPVKELIPEMLEELKLTSRLIIHAPAGAGKSTVLPLALMTFETDLKIIIIEPRRLAAKTIAERMASLLNESAGEQIGYRIRFDTKVSSATKVEVVTEGVFMRLLQTDNALENYGMVLFDEFHERNLQSDLAFSLVLDLQKVLRPELKMIMMSATLAVDEVQAITGAKVLESKGRQYPVDLIYTGNVEPEVLALETSRIVRRALDEYPGDVLVFLPGEREIKECEQLLKDKVELAVQIHVLYGMLDRRRQLAAILPDRQGRRKIILATSIAETSLTIEGVRIVVDSGYTRMGKFDPRSGLSRLETVSVTIDSADQRSGRAGRLTAGVAYRMWSPARQQQLIAHRVPEIMEADLAGFALELSRWGIFNPKDLDWLTEPPAGAYGQALDLLKGLGAIEENRLTKHGRDMGQLPCHPRIAHLLLSVKDHSKLGMACDIAALLEERDPLTRERNCDLNLRLERWYRQRQLGKIGPAFKQLDRVSAAYRKMMKCEESCQQTTIDPYYTGNLLAYAYPERIACQQGGQQGIFQLSNGALVRIPREDDLSVESWLVVASLNQRGNMGRVFLASPVNPMDLQAMLSVREIVRWDSREKEIISRKEWRLGNLLLRSVPLEKPDPEKLASAILDGIHTDGYSLLNFSSDVTQLQNRVLSMRKWDHSVDWPDFTTDYLLAHCEKWLGPYLSEIRNEADLKKIDLKQILFYSLSPELQQSLREMVPERISVPSGSNLKLDYQANGSAPVLAVRIQEMFGLTQTPAIFNGKQKVLIHLLSPGYKPVQITDDLESFWSTTYFEVRKELRRRYPKHEWPDDPHTTPPIRGVKRKK